jgi:RNA polymerase sigma-70 factor (ECF subfamily)
MSVSATRGAADVLYPGNIKMKEHGDGMERDAEELTAFLAQDLPTAFEKVVLAYQDQLYAFALARVGDALTAEEIVQSALIRAYYALRQYPRERILVLRLSAWLYEITRNTLYNYQRDHQKQVAQSLDLSAEEAHLLLEDQGSGPEDEIFRQEERHELDTHLSRLPQHFQRAIRLYYFDNLSYQEIATRLALPIGTVKSHIHRGMRLLRAQMREV